MDESAMNLQPTFSSARRINDSLTAAAEKRALQWMAERAPSWLTSDQLTLLGLFSQLAAGLFYILAKYERFSLILVTVCIVLNWLGDSMDGTLARVRNQQRPRYGFYVDHMVDIFGATGLMCGLGFSGFVHWPIAAAMLIAFLLLSAESYLATCTLSRFHMSQGIFGPTEIRILLLVGTVSLLRSPYAAIFGERFLLFDVGGLIAATIMFAMAIVTSISHAAELYRDEPLPRSLGAERLQWVDAGGAGSRRRAGNECNERDTEDSEHVGECVQGLHSVK